MRKEWEERKQVVIVEIRHIIPFLFLISSFPFLSWRREEIFTLSTVAMVARGWKPGGGRGKEEEEEEKEEEEDGEEEVK